MTVNTDIYPAIFNLRDICNNLFYQRSKLPWSSVAYSVRNINSSSSSLYNGSNYPVKKIVVRSASIFWRKFDIRTERFCKLDHGDSCFDYMIGGHSQFFLHMNWRCSKKSVDTRSVRIFDSIISRLDIFFLCNCFYRLKIAG